MEWPISPLVDYSVIDEGQTSDPVWHGPFPVWDWESVATYFLNNTADVADYLIHLIWSNEAIVENMLAGATPTFSQDLTIDPESERSDIFPNLGGYLWVSMESNAGTVSYAAKIYPTNADVPTV